MKVIVVVYLVIGLLYTAYIFGMIITVRKKRLVETPETFVEKLVWWVKITLVYLFSCVAYPLLIMIGLGAKTVQVVDNDNL